MAIPVYLVIFYWLARLATQAYITGTAKRHTETMMLLSAIETNTRILKVKKDDREKILL